MNVAVIGAGNGGCAVAFDFANHGHAVSLFDFENFPAAIAAVAATGGISAEGDLEGFAPIVYSGHDVEKAVADAELILLVGPSYSTVPMAVACRPFLRPGHTVIVCPGSCGGALAFKQAAGLSLRDDSVVVAETHTLPYGVRVTEPGRIHVGLKLRGGLHLAALPASGTEKVLDMVRDVYPDMTAGANVLFTSLQNSNPIIHPCVTLANAAAIERTAGDFLFYEEGITPAVARLIEAVDRDRVAVGAAAGCRIRLDPDNGVAQGYMTEPSYYPGYMTGPAFKGVKAQPQLDHRYFNEDVGYGLVFMQSVGRQFGVPTPSLDAVVHIASVMMGRDYSQGPRTMASLGLAGYSASELTEALS